MGALFVQAISARDIPLVQAVSLLITAFIVLVNLGVDVLYLVLDPRVRAGAELSAHERAIRVAHDAVPVAGQAPRRARRLPRARAQHPLAGLVLAS